MQGRQCGVAGEGGAAAQGRAERRAEGPDVGRRALRPAGDALGGHVVGRADQHPDHRQRLGVLDRGDAEVREDDPPPPAGAPAVPSGRGRPGRGRPLRVLHQDVPGLDVPVQDAPRVDLPQRRDETEPDPGRLAGAEGPLLREDPLQGTARDQLHDDPQAFALVDHVVDPYDVGVVDPGRGPGLAQGAFAARPAVLGVMAVDPHFLDGDLPVEYFVGGSPHPPHSPLADTLDQAIAPRHQYPWNTAAVRIPRQFAAPPPRRRDRLQ